MNVEQTFDAIRVFFRNVPMQLAWVRSEVVDKILQKENIHDVEAKEILTQKFLETCREIERLLSTEEISREDLFLWDWAFLKMLIKIGPFGKEFAKQLLPKLESDFITYCESKVLSQYTNQVSMLLVLGESIWLDVAKNLWIRKKKMSQRSPRGYGSLRSNLFSTRKLISH
ncbi:MAG: hypothetical protein WCG10_03195 [Chlamydiota bacterium]